MMPSVHVIQSVVTNIVWSALIVALLVSCVELKKGLKASSFN
jgi:hypothetical protein